MWLKNLLKIKIGLFFLVFLAEMLVKKFSKIFSYVFELVTEGYFIIIVGFIRRKGYKCAGLPCFKIGEFNNALNIPVVIYL